eukprot:491961-Prymnesium_polylepis.1
MPAFFGVRRLRLALERHTTKTTEEVPAIAAAAVGAWLAREGGLDENTAAGSMREQIHRCEQIGLDGEVLCSLSQPEWST